MECVVAGERHVALLEYPFSDELVLELFDCEMGVVDGGLRVEDRLSPCGSRQDSEAGVGLLGLEGTPSLDDSPLPRSAPLSREYKNQAAERRPRTPEDPATATHSYVGAGPSSAGRRYRPA